MSQFKLARHKHWFTILIHFKNLFCWGSKQILGTVRYWELFIRKKSVASKMTVNAAATPTIVNDKYVLDITGKLNGDWNVEWFPQHNTKPQEKREKWQSDNYSLFDRN